jgi:hypothetical protein
MLARTVVMRLLSCALLAACSTSAFAAFISLDTSHPTDQFEVTAFVSPASEPGSTNSISGFQSPLPLHYVVTNFNSHPDLGAWSSLAALDASYGTSQATVAVWSSASRFGVGNDPSASGFAIIRPIWFKINPDPGELNGDPITAYLHHSMLARGPHSGTPSFQAIAGFELGPGYNYGIPGTPDFIPINTTIGSSFMMSVSASSAAPLNDINGLDLRLVMSLDPTPPPPLTTMDPPAIPEPASWVLFAAGPLGLVGIRFAKTKRVARAT